MLNRGVWLWLGLALAGVMPAGAAPALEPQFLSVPVPRSVVAGLSQDRAGFLWVGTGDGLARFDGYRLRPIERPGATAVQRNLGWVRAMAPARDGGMWIGTEREGLAHYDPDRDRVTMRGSAAAAQGPSAAIRCLATDAQGRVWVGTLGEGLSLYDPSKRRFERQTLEWQGTPEARVLALQLGADGSVWAGHWQGLAHRAAGSTTWSTVATPDGERARVTALLADSQGRIWVGTGEGRLGRVESGQIRWLQTQLSGPVQALAQAPDGTIWVGTRNGIEWIAPDSGARLHHLSRHPDGPAGLAGEDVTTLLTDHEGAVWVGGPGLGLQRLRRHPALAVRGPGGALSSASARALLALQDGRLLVATHNGPVALLATDAALSSLGPWPWPDQRPIDAFAQGPDGNLWLVSAGQLQRHKPDGTLLRRWRLEGGRTQRLLALANGEVWIGMQEGLYRLADAQAEAVERIQGRDGQTLVGGVHALLAEPDGKTLWVGGVQGLLRWREGRLEAVEFAPGEGLGFPVVMGLLRGKDGTLWVDTHVAGLHRLLGWDAQGRARLVRISERHGVAGRPFGANLHQDSQGRIWSQSFVYDPKDDRLDEIGAADGAEIGTPWFYADTELPDGRLLFGGSQGLLVVRPLSWKPSRRAPPVVVTQIRVDGQPHAPASLAQGVRLPAGSISVGIEFAALDYADPQRLRYLYRLDGLDPRWIAADAGARNPSFNRLAPGRYRLQVRASNHHGFWGERALELPIEVEPAWWQTGWARALGVLLGLAAVWAWVRLRTHGLRQRELELQREVEARTVELREASLTDSLTSLRNRRYLSLRIEDDLAQCLRGHEDPLRRQSEGKGDLVLMLLDLDHFKQINDGHGHAAGDAVLVEMAERLRQLFRSSDSLVRWGGEEFLALVRDSSRAEAEELARRLVEAVRGQPFTLPDGSPLQVTASVGFAVFPPDPEAPQAWSWNATLSLADSALYAAKAQGRDGYVGAIGVRGLRPEQAPSQLRDWVEAERIQVARSG